MTDKQKKELAILKAIFKYLLIGLLWYALELGFHGELRQSNEDTIISIFLFWYIWKSELLRLRMY